jgi:hypothetical protein
MKTLPFLDRPRLSGELKRLARENTIIGKPLSMPPCSFPPSPGDDTLLKTLPEDEKWCIFMKYHHEQRAGN